MELFLTVIKMKRFLFQLQLILMYAAIILTSCTENASLKNHIFIDRDFNYFYVDSNIILFNDAYSPLQITADFNKNSLDSCLYTFVKTIQRTDNVRHSDCNFTVENSIGQQILFTKPKSILIDTTINCETIYEIYSRSIEDTTLIWTVHIDKNRVKTFNKNESFISRVNSESLNKDIRILYQSIGSVSLNQRLFNDSELIYFITINCNEKIKSIKLNELPKILKNTRSLLDEIVQSR